MPIPQTKADSFDPIAEAAARSVSSRQKAQAEIERQINEYLRRGGTVNLIDGTTYSAASGNFNIPISEKSQRIAESFKRREKKKQ